MPVEASLLSDPQTQWWRVRGREAFSCFRVLSFLVFSGKEREGPFVEDGL